MTLSARRIASAFRRADGEATNPDQLVSLLGMFHALYWLQWTTHWQMQGEPFYADHLLFEKMYTGMVPEIDALAEKMVQIYGRDAVAVESHFGVMAAWVSRWLPEQDPYGRALGAERDFQAGIKQVYDEMKALGVLSLGMDDFLMSTASAHETNLYLLQQRMGGIQKHASVLRDCDIFKATDGQWYMELQNEPNEEDEDGEETESEDYEMYGPFPSEAAVEQYLRAHFANPGGLSRDDSGKEKPPTHSRSGQRLKKPSTVVRWRPTGFHYAKLDGNGEPDLSAEGHFFDRPRSREVREFAESQATSNVDAIAMKSVEETPNGNTKKEERAAVAEAPPTPTEIIDTTPGGADFSSLSRYLVQTEEPTDAGVPKSRDDIPKHPDLVRTPSMKTPPSKNATLADWTFARTAGDDRIMHQVQESVARSYRAAWGRAMSPADLRDAVKFPEDTRRDDLSTTPIVIFTEYAGLSQYDNDRFWIALRKELQKHGLHYELIDGGTATVWPR